MCESVCILAETEMCEGLFLLGGDIDVYMLRFNVSVCWNVTDEPETPAPLSGLTWCDRTDTGCRVQHASEGSTHPENHLYTFT